MEGMTWKYSASLVTILLLLQGITGLGVDSSYERSFTPMRNISCAQCKTEIVGGGTGEKSMLRRLENEHCLNSPQKYFKPCSTDKGQQPRGCATVFTHVDEPEFGGKIRSFDLIHRLCSSSGAKENERGWTSYDSANGYTLRYICGDDNCNRAPSLSSHLGWTGVMLVLTIAGQAFME